MEILQTERLILRQVVADDAVFILDLLNQPSFIRYIGDRGVRTVPEAREFIENRYRQSYYDFGYGLYVVELRAGQTPLGICGFVKREPLPDADIGFAFLPQHWQQGYAYEAAAATLEYGRKVLGLKRVLAITSQANTSSGRLLEKLGFEFERLLKMPHDDYELKLFSQSATGPVRGRK